MVVVWGGRTCMLDEQNLAVTPQGSGLIFWVPASNKRVAWLRYGILFALLPFLFALPGFFGDGHSPDAPDLALGLASFLVVFITGWMALVDALFRLAERTTRLVVNYLIAFGLTVVFTLMFYGGSLLSDHLITPSGHYFAVQGVFVIVLLLAVAPIARCA